MFSVALTVSHPYVEVSHSVLQLNLEILFLSEHQRRGKVLVPCALVLPEENLKINLTGCLYEKVSVSFTG